MRPAEVWGCLTQPRASSRAISLRMVALEKASPANLAMAPLETGSPVSE